MRVDPEMSLTKFLAAAVWAAVRISPRWASSAFRGGRGGWSSTWTGDHGTEVAG